MLAVIFPLPLEMVLSVSPEWGDVTAVIVRVRYVKAGLCIYHPVQIQNPVDSSGSFEVRQYVSNAQHRGWPIGRIQ